MVKEIKRRFWCTKQSMELYKLICLLGLAGEGLAANVNIGRRQFNMFESLFSLPDYYRPFSQAPAARPHPRNTYQTTQPSSASRSAPRPAPRPQPKPAANIPKSHMVTYAVNEAPEPKVAYPDSCPRWKLNYQYPAWRFESKNDYGCQFNKLPLRRNFKVEMNRCSDFPKGQCTEWVDGRFFQLTGAHTMFNGDATEWDVLARGKPEWSVSTVPSVPSIIVMKNWLPNVEKEGHVGIVESINEDGSVCTSNWNFPTLMRIGMRNIKPGPGIFFIRYIGKPAYSSK